MAGAMHTDRGTRILATVLGLAIAAADRPARADSRVEWTGPSGAARGLLDRAGAHPELEAARFEIPTALVEDYVRRLTNAVPEEPAPPATVLYSRWQAFVRPSDRAASVSVVMTGTVLRATAAEPAGVRLFPLPTVFSDLRVNGQPASPLRQQCLFAVPFTTPGPFQITATLAVTPSPAGLEQRLLLHQPGFAITSVHVDSDEAWDVVIAGKPGRLLGTPGQGTHGVLSPGRNQTIALGWRRPEPPSGRRGLVSVTPSLAWTIGDTLVAVNGRLDVAVLGGTADQVTLVLPGQADRVSVTGPDVRHFRSTASGLEIAFRGALSGRTTVDLAFEMPRGHGGLIACRDPGVKGGRLNDGGWLLVAYNGDGELLEHSTEGIEPCGSSEVPAPVLGLLAGKPLFSYRRTGHRAVCVLDPFATQPFPVVDTIADRAEVTAVLRPDGEEMVRVAYAMRNNRKQFLQVAMPTGARVLWLSVEGRTVRPLGGGERLLVPLVKSVQTLEGLVAFPIEIVYCRKAAPLAGATERALDLPEIADVPVAVVRATVYTPEGIAVRRASGVLARVESFSTGGGMVYGRGYASVAGGATAPELILHTLAESYYDAGYKAYRRGSLEEAEGLFANAVRTEPDAPGSADARKMLSNIRAGRGDVRAENREEKAKIARVQKELQADNSGLEARQQALVDDAEKMIQSGNEEFGARFFEEAAYLGRKLVQRGGAQREQRSIAGKFQDKLAELRDREREHAELRRRLRAAGDDVSRLALSASNATDQVANARRLTAALAETAASNQISLGDVQDAIFETTAAAGKQADVDSRVLALRYQDSQAAAQPDAAQAPSASRAGRSLSGEIARLRPKVLALEQAAKKARSDPAPAPAATPAALGDQAVVDARRQIRKVDENLQAVVREADPSRGSAATADAAALRARIGQLQTLAATYAGTYGVLDPQLNRELGELQQRVASGRRQVEDFIEQRRKAPETILDLGGVAQSESDRKAFVRFLDENVLPRVRDNAAQFDVSDGRLVVANRGANAAVLGEAIERLRRNSGLAVPVTGLSVPLRTPVLSQVPAIGRLFDRRTGDGRPFAVLDEAQVRTLLAAGGGAAGAENRSVIVGTGSRVAGEDIRLARSGADYNSLELGGAEVRLPANGYLAVDRGGTLVVLKAGTAAPWSSAARGAAPELAADAALTPPALPLAGEPLLLEKTLLAAGESPDIVFTYNERERRRWR